jgi:two-component system nitrate/nitrite response regulator NarL
MTYQKEKLSLIIADDHPVVLEGIAKVLENESDFDLQAKCLNGADAFRAIQEQRPDIAVLDISMPEMNGLEILSRMNSEGLMTKVIFLTANATDAHILALIEQGAMGLLVKDTAISDLAPCIRRVVAGQRHFPRDLVTAAVERETGRRSVGMNFERVLSPREREVLLLVAEGFANKDVARQLNLSEGTVKIHVHNIYQKTGIGSRAALAALALAHREFLQDKSF